MAARDQDVMRIVDDRTKLVGHNKMELLLFSLGSKEVFGINVFKVREVCETPEITRTPNRPKGVQGIISLRGSIIPVIDLSQLMGVSEERNKTKLIITEFSQHTQAFQVSDVDRIIRVDWEQVRSPQAMLAGATGLVTAITELPDGKLVSILDVEQIMSDTFGQEDVPALAPLAQEQVQTIFFADDSALARKRISQVLDQLGLPHQEAHNGQEAWDKLSALADHAQAEGSPMRAKVGLVLVDAEMPEMDGYVLTQNIKNDERFRGIPVVMHSSLSSSANRKMGQQVGVDAYVAKFDPAELAQTITGMLHS